jgi:hypothetical protein
MPNPSIKRPAVTLDTRNQLGLFALEGLDESNDKLAAKPKPMQ